MSIHNQGLSILLPVVKVEYLEECLDSLLHSVSRIEVKAELIIIKAREVKLPDLQQYGKLEIKVHDLLGANYSEAVMCGVENSNFEVIALMNDDDLVSPYRFQEQIEILFFADTDLVITNFKKFGKKQPTLGLNFNPGRLYHHSYLFLGPYGANATWMFQKDWFYKYKEIIGTSNNFDWSFALSSFKNSKIKYISETLYFYRQHQTQITMHESYREKLFDDMHALLARQIKNQFNLAIGINTIRALAFPYLRNQITSQVARELICILAKIWNSKESRGFWLLYQITIRILFMIYWRCRKVDEKNV